MNRNYFYLHDIYLSKILDMPKFSDISLSDGLAGHLMYLAQLFIGQSDLQKKNLIESIALECIQKASYSNYKLLKSQRGLWTGPLGLSAAIDTWYQISSIHKNMWRSINVSFYSSIRSIIEVWASQSITDMNEKFDIDWIFGLSGVLAYISNCSIAKKDEKHKKRFLQYSTKMSSFSSLITNTKKEIGFAHGFSGLLFSLIQFNRSFCNSNTNTILNLPFVKPKIIDIETHVKKYINFCNLDSELSIEKILTKPKTDLLCSWCTGIMGLLISLNTLHVTPDLTRFTSKFQANISSFSFHSHTNQNFYCLCHGIGSIELLYYYFGEQLPNNLIIHSTVDTQDIENFNFLNGLGGVLTLENAMNTKKKFLADWMFGYNHMISTKKQK